MYVTEIKWDTDGDQEVFETLPQKVKLPEDKFNEENYTVDGEFDEDAFWDDVSDWLSDEFGFCHAGFDVVKECK